jgi:type I restriction enzyme S subunit
MKRLSDLCTPNVSNIREKDLAPIGQYPCFGASGIVGYRDVFDMSLPYVGIVKDGAGVGRTSLYPAKSSLLGTLQCLQPVVGVDSKYLMYLVRSLHLENAFQGSTIPHIYFKNYKKNFVKERSLGEQRAIAEELSLFEKNIKTKREQLLELDSLTKSRFNEMFGAQFSNTESSTRIKDIATATIGLTYRPENVKSEGGTIVLRSGNIQNNELCLEDDIVRVNNIKINEDKYIYPLDILMCSRNGSAKLVGKSCLITEVPERMSYGAFMTVIRTRFPYFMQGFLCSEFFKQQLTGTQTASVNQITSGMLLNYTTIKPSNENEKDFASFVQLIDKSKFVVHSKYFL